MRATTASQRTTPSMDVPPAHPVWPLDAEESDLAARIEGMPIERPAQLDVADVAAYSRFVELLAKRGDDECLALLGAAYAEAKDLALMQQYDGCG